MEPMGDALVLCRWVPGAWKVQRCSRGSAIRANGVGRREITEDACKQVKNELQTLRMMN